MEIAKTRSILTIDLGRGVVTKRYRDPELAATEIHWYRNLGYGHPELLDADVDAGILVTRYHPPCTDLPDYQPVRELIELLERLEADHMHHRDVHIENVVQGPRGPLLIDWESGLRLEAPSYDLRGPEVSGVPAPDIHLRWPHYRMWIGSDHKKSLKTRWGLTL